MIELKPMKMLAAGILVSASMSAIANDSGDSVFASDGQPIVVAEARAVFDERYKHRYMEMMDEDTMAMLDMNDDSMVSSDEFARSHEMLFDSMDENQDGMLERNELMLR